jgi:hypothetical protein
LTTINIGDKVRFTDTSHSDWLGQEGIVEKVDGLVHYRITKAVSPAQFGPYVPHFNTVGNTVKVDHENLTVIEPENPAEPEAKFKVGDVVRLTKKGGTQQGMAYIREGMRATLTRVHWYSRSGEWGYKLDIPGITTDPDLSWVKHYEFYDGHFVLESELKKAPLSALKKAKAGTVVWDSEGDKWVRVSKKNDIWVYKRKGYDGCQADALFVQTSEDLRSDFAPISFIKP